MRVQQEFQAGGGIVRTTNVQDVQHSSQLNYPDLMLNNQLSMPYAGHADLILHQAASSSNAYIPFQHQQQLQQQQFYVGQSALNATIMNMNAGIDVNPLVTEALGMQMLDQIGSAGNMVRNQNVLRASSTLPLSLNNALGIANNAEHTSVPMYGQQQDIQMSQIPNSLALDTTHSLALLPAHQQFQNHALNPNPSFLPEAKPSGRPPVMLSVSCDDEILSEYQSLARKQIEIFEAREEDVESNAQGRNRPIVMGQVGIRCRHCVMLPPKHRARGAVYYPAKLQGLYQAAQNMASGHLCKLCPNLPTELRTRLVKLKEKKSSTGGGKVYWADAARVLGVCEDSDGLKFEQQEVSD